MELPRFSAARSKFFCMVVVPDVFLPRTIAPSGPKDHPLRAPAQDRHLWSRHTGETALVHRAGPEPSHAEIIRASFGSNPLNVEPRLWRAGRWRGLHSLAFFAGCKMRSE